MQVLLALVDADGDLVTREALLSQCWDGLHVGDDALNRAIFELRRALRLAGAIVSVETIPKAGYRLVGPPEAVEASAAVSTLMSRRVVLGGFAGTIVLGGAALIAVPEIVHKRQAADLVAHADLIRRDDMPDAAGRAAILLRKALELTPNNAVIWGKLALALGQAAEESPPAKTAAAVSATQNAYQKALSLDPGSPDARVALAMLTPHFGAWYPVVQTLREILADAPDNIAAQANLSLVLMEVGYVAAGAGIMDRLIEREPLSPTFQYRHVFQLWARGRIHEADQVVDRALQLWPRHTPVWLARVWTFALTGRAPAALAMVEDPASTPLLPPLLLNVLKLSCRALLSRSASDVAAAVTANGEAARRGQFGVISAIMVLPELGAVDVALEIVRGYLMREGRMVGLLRRPLGEPMIDQQNRREIMPLWMPSAAPLRADPRFLPLCKAVGLEDFWQRSRQMPDFLAGVIR